MLVNVTVVISDLKGNTATGHKTYCTAGLDHKAAEYQAKTKAGEAFRDAAYAGEFYNPRDR